MILKVLNNKILSNVVGTKVSIKGKSHHNILIGDKCYGGWQYRIGIDDSIVEQPSNKEIELEDDDYTLIAVPNKNGQQVDAQDNLVYFISKSRHRRHKGAIVVLSFTYNGEYSLLLDKALLIGTGKSVNLNVVYDMPTLAFTKTSNTVLSYNDPFGNKVTTFIRYNEDKDELDIQQTILKKKD